VFFIHLVFNFIFESISVNLHLKNACLMQMIDILFDLKILTNGGGGGGGGFVKKC
jgi:hypothetical protein